MRPFVSSCALAAALCCAVPPSLAHGQSWLRQAIPTEMRSHDFGTVARAANTEHRFTIKNVHQTDMHIRSVRASCGCTTPIIENQWIKPGETGTILARFNTGTFTGQKAATLTVTIDKPQYTELQLNVKGYIRRDIVLSPGEANFGHVPEGESKSIDLNLDYAGKSDWAVTKISSPLPFVKANLKETSRASGRVQYKITAVLEGGAPAGFLQHQLILHTNDRRLTSVPLRIHADVQPALQVSPQTLVLGQVKPGEPIQQRLVIKGRKPFRILEISSESAEILYDPIPAVKPAHLINVTISPKATIAPGEVKGHMLLRTDLTDAPKKIELSYRIVSQSPSGVTPPAEVHASK